MNNRLKNLIDQLEPNEQKKLEHDIQKDYGVELQCGMLRDDIKDKLFETLCISFEWLGSIEENNLLLKHLELDSSDLNEFINYNAENFNLPGVSFSVVKEWKTVKDIIDYIEENQEIPYISGFELEA